MNDKKKKTKRRIKLRTLFFLAITLASNSFAWFVYSTKVSNNITAKVRSWHVNFEIGSGETIEEYIEINIDSLYPGMDSYQKVLRASNSGEADAKINYKIEKATILGDDLLALYLTDEEILNKIRKDYPFIIDFNVSNNIISKNGGEATIAIDIKWPYESGNDDKDTYWGNRAYDFHKVNSNTPSISLIVKITAIQIDNTNVENP